MSCAYHYTCGGNCDAYERERAELLVRQAEVFQKEKEKGMTLIDPYEKEAYDAEVAERAKKNSAEGRPVGSLESAGSGPWWTARCGLDPCDMRHPLPACKSDRCQYKTQLPTQGPGYHVTAIRKGEIGELSKIQEELDEVRDAVEQGAKVMVLVELSDMVGAIESFLEKHHRGTSLDDLLKMSEITRRAFRNGARK